MIQKRKQKIYAVSAVFQPFNGNPRVRKFDRMRVSSTVLIYNDVIKKHRKHVFNAGSFLVFAIFFRISIWM